MGIFIRKSSWTSRIRIIEILAIISNPNKSTYTIDTSFEKEVDVIPLLHSGIVGKSVFMVCEPVVSWNGELSSVNAVSSIEVKRFQAVQAEDISGHFILISIVQYDHFFDGAPAAGVGINRPDSSYSLNPKLLVQAQNKRRV
ncbi:MAG: hypothetical protein BMS9Abin02_1919 [Anaerolineae bacterium]|nr:MAG: hypothetical protein BMS9Abin02_1919 [Anaerolineae bacterium]